jgi:hypothetical protein
MKKMNNQYSQSVINQNQNVKKIKKIICTKRFNNENPVKLIKQSITNLNSIYNKSKNINLNISKKLNNNDFEEEFEIIEPNSQKNTIKKSKDIIRINNKDNHSNSSNKNLNSNNTGLTTNADSKSLNLYPNEEINNSISLRENNKMKIIKKPRQNFGLSARELMDIVNKRKKILGIRSNYFNKSKDNFHEKSDDIVQTSLYYDNFNDVSNSISENNFINMSFSQVNTLKLSNIKKNTIKKKLVINHSKDIANFIFDEEEKEKKKEQNNFENINKLYNGNLKFEIENNNVNNILKDNKNIKINNYIYNNEELKNEETLFHIQKNSQEINLNDFKIETNNNYDDTFFDKNSIEKSSILNGSISSQVKLSISSSSSNKEEEVIQFEDNNEIQFKNQNKIKEINEISLFNLKKKEIKKDETMTKEKINFFEETLNKIPKKVNNDKINENLLKLLPPSPNIMKKKNLVKFNSKNTFNSENKKEKHVRNMKSFDIDQERKSDFQPSDYCILKTSSLEKKSNRSGSKNSRNKKLRQVGKYTDFYKNRIIGNCVIDKKKKNSFNIEMNNKKKKNVIMKIKNKK